MTAQDLYQWKRDTDRNGLVMFLPQEEQEYFQSEWYQEKMKNLRQALIKKGLITKPAWHRNNIR